jgi:hypothetical protein
MEIGTRVVVCESKHPLFNFKGSIVGRRGPKGPDDMWLLIYIDNRGRSYLIPKSMVRPMTEEEDQDNKSDFFGDKNRFN